MMFIDSSDDVEYRCLVAHWLNRIEIPEQSSGSELFLSFPLNNN
jgi:hypothetical protein